MWGMGGNQCYHSTRVHERKNVCGGLCLGRGTGHTQGKERREKGNHFKIGNVSLRRPLNHPETWVHSVCCHERQSITFPAENPYLVADFQCGLELKCANPGPEVVSSSFWKCCNRKSIEAVMDTRETPSGDLAAPSWKTEVLFQDLPVN